MILAIIDDNWGLAFGTVFIIGAFQTHSLITKVILILLGLFFITMNIWKGWFRFYSQPKEDENETPNDKEPPKSE